MISTLICITRAQNERLLNYQRRFVIFRSGKFTDDFIEKLPDPGIDHPGAFFKPIMTEIEKYLDLIKIIPCVRISV
jgi:hypothetical protein